MAHAYQSVKSFREGGSQVTWNMKTTNQIFLLILFESWRFLKISFLQLKPIYGGGDGGFLKYMSVNPIELEVVGKNNVFQIYQYFKCSSYSRVSLSQTRKSFGWRVLERDCMCYIWFHKWNYLLLESLQVRVSKIC